MLQRLIAQLDFCVQKIKWTLALKTICIRSQTSTPDKISLDGLTHMNPSAVTDYFLFNEHFFHWIICEKFAGQDSLWDALIP